MIYIIEKLQLNALKLPRNYAALLPSFIGRELHIDPRQISHCEIISSSIDSRRGTPKLVLKLLFETGQKLSRFAPASPEEIAALAVPDPELPDSTSLRHPIVVGTGPAGISAAYLLAAAGCAPVIIDRGFPVEKRAADYRKFLSAGCSVPPIDALKLAGIDMSSPEPVRKAMEVFRETVEKMKKVAESL